MVKTCVTFCENNCVLYLKKFENQLTDCVLQYVCLNNNKFQLLNKIFLTDQFKKTFF